MLKLKLIIVHMIFLSRQNVNQNSIIRNFVRKWNKLPRALRKEKSKKKFKKELKEEMQKRRERVPMDKKIEGFKSLFL